MGQSLILPLPTSPPSPLVPTVGVTTYPVWVMGLRWYRGSEGREDPGPLGSGVGEGWGEGIRDRPSLIRSTPFEWVFRDVEVPPLGPLHLLDSEESRPPRRHSFCLSLVWEGGSGSRDCVPVWVSGLPKRSLRDTPYPSQGASTRVYLRRSSHSPSVCPLEGPKPRGVSHREVPSEYSEETDPPESSPTLSPGTADFPVEGPGTTTDVGTVGEWTPQRPILPS